VWVWTIFKLNAIVGIGDLRPALVLAVSDPAVGNSIKPVRKGDTSPPVVLDVPERLMEHGGGDVAGNFGVRGAPERVAIYLTVVGVV